MNYGLYTFMATTEENIIQLLQARDKQVIEVIYDLYAPTLYGVILKIVHSEEIARDVLQDTFIKAWDKGNTFNGQKGTLFTWLLNIARNTAIDKTRSAAWKKKAQVEDLQAVISQADQYRYTETPIEHIGVRSLVDKLHPAYREMIELAYFQGFTQEEITQRLAIPLGTVKSRMRAALRDLRQMFTEHGVVGLLLLIWNIITRFWES